MRRFHPAVVAVLLAAGCSSTVQGSPVAAGGQVAPQTAAVTEFVDYTPWNGNALADGANTVAAGNVSSCLAGSLSGREGTFRCFTDSSGVYDPCFVNPSGSQLACPLWGGQVALLRNSTALPASTYTSRQRVFRVVLTDGTECAAASGAGPMPIGDYGWAMSCRTDDGGYGIVWFRGDGSAAAQAEADARANGGLWEVKITRNTEQGPLEAIGVRTAYR